MNFEIKSEIKGLKSSNELKMWQGTVGLLNGQHKYLTAESFGHKINANGTAMKKKQQWSLELFPLEQGSAGPTDELSEVDFVSIKSPLNCYLAVDSYGNVTCDSSEKTDKCRFIITICSMSSGSSSTGKHFSAVWQVHMSLQSI